MEFYCFISEKGKQKRRYSATGDFLEDSCFGSLFYFIILGLRSFVLQKLLLVWNYEIIRFHIKHK